MSYKSAIFWHIKLKFSIRVHLDGFYSMYSGLYDKPKCFEKKNQKYIFFFENSANSFFVFFSFKNWKIRDGSSVDLSILRHFLQINWLLLKHWVQESNYCRPIFCIEIARTWRHSDAISGQPIVGTFRTNFLFAHIGCTLDGLKRTAVLKVSRW